MSLNIWASMAKERHKLLQSYYIITKYSNCEHDMSQSINKSIDHTLLKPQANEDEIITLCKEAREYNFATVCVNPTHVELASKELKGCDVGVCTVIGFPLGATLSKVKAFETLESIRKGATEIDMVINIGALKSKNFDVALSDIKAVVEVAQKTPVKVIIETALLTDEEKIKACEMSELAGATFVKTSTGFAGGGATIEDVELMRKTVSQKVLIKASGGIRDLETAHAMITAGATRLGTSSGVKLVNGKVSTSSY